MRSRTRLRTPSAPISAAAGTAACPNVSRWLKTATTGSAAEAEKAAGFYSVSNPGTFYLEGAYGGHKLVQVINYGGGVRDVLRCGYVSKRELYHLIGALLDGVGTIAETMAIRERAGSIEREIQERKDHRERVRLQILKAHSETVGS